MRSCPKCNAEFDDSMSFCTEDGTPLDGETVAGTPEAATKVIAGSRDASNDLSAAVTEVLTAPKVEESGNAAGDYTGSIETQTARITGSSRGTGFGMMLGALLVIGLLLLGTAIGGIFWYIRGQRPVDVATANSGNVNQLPASPPGTPTFEGSDANLPGENRPGSNLVVEMTPTPGPSPTLKPEPTPSETVEKEAPATPAPKPGRIRTVSGGVLNGKAISLPEPVYPPAARAVGANGSVNVQVLVDQNGNVIRAKAVSGHRLLRNSAERAARGARFRPPELGNEPVNIAGVIVYVFRAN